MDILNKGNIYTEVIESPEFQRLKGISFLGILGYCSDSSRFSTRYEHSLSVANKCFEYADKKEFSEKERIYIVLAGLLHDLGHCGFSHSLEPVFSERFSITHHDFTKQLILSSPNLTKIWDKYSIYANRIVDVIEGHSDRKDKVVTKMCINFDTLDGIARAEGHFSDNDKAMNICNHVFYIMCNENDWKSHTADFDAFWELKDRVYSSYIYDEKLGIMESIFHELFMKEAYLEPGHFYLTDSEMQHEFPWVSQFINDMRRDYSLGSINNSADKIKKFGDMVGTSTRRFLINSSKGFSVFRNKRYSVLEEIRASYI